jgi:hypothetical protein
MFQRQTCAETVGYGYKKPVFPIIHVSAEIAFGKVSGDADA